MKHHWRRWITPLCSLLLLGLALTLLYHLTHEWRWKDVRHALGSCSPRSLLNALLMTLEVGEPLTVEHLKGAFHQLSSLNL